VGNLFAYGTLMCEDIVVEASGCRLPHVPGVFRGYSRRSVTGEHDPATVPGRERFQGHYKKPGAAITI